MTHGFPSLTCFDATLFSRMFPLATVPGRPIVLTLETCYH